MDGRSYIDAVRAYADIVYRTALSYTKAPQDAEDVTQTVFMKLLETGDSFADEEHLRRWLIRVTVNECKNLWKSFWKRRVGLAEKTEPEEQEAYDYTGYTKRGRVRECRLRILNLTLFRRVNCMKQSWRCPKITGRRTSFLLRGLPDRGDCRTSSYS